MKRHIDYKIPGGKLLRIDLEMENNIIQDIKITGDFFIYPEEGILSIENSLRGVDKNQVVKALKKSLSPGKIKIIGFDISDIERAISSLP